MQNWLAQPPSWVIQIGVGAILGAIFGLVLPILVRAVRWLLTSRQRHPLHGDWYCYYFSTSDRKRVFKAEQWCVSRGLRFPLAVRTRSICEQPLIEYRGHMIIEENHYLLVDMDSISSHKEKVYIRFSYSMAARGRPIVGIGIQYDYDNHPEASINVLSSRKLTEQEFKELVKEHIVIPHDRMSLRCK